MLAALVADFLRHAWRGLRRAPRSLTSVATLALAIGAVAGMFNVVHGSPGLPFAEPDRLVLLAGTRRARTARALRAWVRFLPSVQENSKLIDIFGFGQLTSTPGRPGPRVAWNAFRWRFLERYLRDPRRIATRPAAGPRGWRPSRRDQRSAVAIRFGRDESVVGQKYFVSGAMREVIGIMPEFKFGRHHAAVGRGRTAP